MAGIKVVFRPLSEETRPGGSGFRRKLSFVPCLARSFSHEAFSSVIDSSNMIRTDYFHSPLVRLHRCRRPSPPVGQGRESLQFPLIFNRALYYGRPAAGTPKRRMRRGKCVPSGGDSYEKRNGQRWQIDAKGDRKEEEKGKGRAVGLLQSQKS